MNWNSIKIIVVVFLSRSETNVKTKKVNNTKNTTNSKKKKKKRILKRK